MPCLLVIELLIHHLQTIHALRDLSLRIEGLLRTARLSLHVKDSFVLFSKFETG